MLRAITIMLITMIAPITMMMISAHQAASERSELAAARRARLLPLTRLLPLQPARMDG